MARSSHYIASDTMRAAARAGSKITYQAYRAAKKYLKGGKGAGIGAVAGNVATAVAQSAIKHVRTKTKTKCKKVTCIKSTDSSMTHSHAVVKHRGRQDYKEFEKVGNKYIQSVIQTNEIVTPEGKQGVTSYNFLQTSYLQQYFVDALTANGGFTSFVPATGAADVRCVVESLTNIYQFGNMSEMAVEYEIYDLVAKQDRDTYIAPDALWQSDYNNTGGSSAAVSLTSTPWTKPTDSKLFSEAWRIAHVTKVEMSAGENHKHTFVNHINRVVDSSMFKQFGVLKNITTAYMIICRGSVVSDTLGAVPSVKISLGRCKVSGITRTRLVLVPVISPQRRITLGNGLAQTMVNEYFSDQKSAAVIDAVLSSTTA